MKRYLFFQPAVLACVGLLMVTAIVHTTSGQAPAPPARQASGNFSGAYGAFGSAGRTGSVPSKPTPKQQIQQAITLLKKAEGDEARAKAAKEVEATLKKLFGEDMARREKEVAGIRRQIEKLKAQLKKRAASRKAILDLQFEVQVNEAEGLGFAVESKPTPNSFRVNTAFPVNVTVGSASLESRVYARVSEDAYAVAEKSLKAAVGKLKAAESDDAEQELKIALEKFFDADLKAREAEIDGIEKRVERLVALIKKRRDAEERIISLQLQVLKNEADGLGFFSSRRQRGRSNGAWVYPMITN